MIYFIAWKLFHWLPSGVIKRGQLGNPLELRVSIGKSTINSVCSIAMFDYQRVVHSPNETWFHPQKWFIKSLLHHIYVSLISPLTVTHTDTNKKLIEMISSPRILHEFASHSLISSGLFPPRGRRKKLQRTPGNPRVGLRESAPRQEIHNGNHGFSVMGWLLVGGLEHDLYFSIYREFHHPKWLAYFSEGLKPPTRLMVIYGD